MCVCVCHWCLWETEEGVGSPRAGVFFFYLLTLIDRRMRYRELSRSLSVAHKSNVLWAPLLHHGTEPTTLGDLSPWLMTRDTAGHWPQGGAVGAGVTKCFRCLQKKARYLYKIISHGFLKNEKTILAQQEGSPYFKNPWLSVLKYLTAWCIFFIFFLLLFKKRKWLSIANLLCFLFSFP